jgi:enoyl-CoA hydratase/carnithine racemase
VNVSHLANLALKQQIDFRSAFASDQRVAYQRLRLDFEARVARLTLTADRIDVRSLDELAAAGEAIAANDHVSVVLLRSEGADFCLGWDDDAVVARLQPGAPVDPFGGIAALPVPVIAVLQGTVCSAGLELALCADVRIASDNARFSLPELSQGLLPLAGGSQRLTRIAGRGAASSMLLLGEELDAPSAMRCGLVSRVVPATDLSAEADTLASHVAERGPIALRYAKEAVRQGIEMSLDQGLRLELDLSVILQTTADRAEGVKAFLEKRKAKFEGR